MIGRKVKITGTVQGVGFRPHVFRLANQTQLAGYVVNRGADVEIFVQGCSSDVQYFVKGLQFELPLLANIDTIICENSDVIPGLKKFSIYPSFNAAHSAVKVADYAICKRCLAEFNHPENRRFQYAFISCTECGPRYSILKQYPLDRKNTSYRNFVMCQQCRKEYEDPENRRFHAQNMSCSACGPGFYLSYNNTRLTDENAALDHCCRSLAAGKIVCVKGISGYRLVCDARNDQVISRLRDMKNRPHKPFALMFPDRNDLSLLHQYVELNKDECIRIKSNKRPILLARKKIPLLLAENIAPGLNSLGVMLPATGLEYLIFKNLDFPLLATSANLPGSCIISDAEMAEKTFSHMADMFLHHNLDIQHALDDSIFKAEYPIRLGRACAPVEHRLPFILDEPVLAFGAQTKNTFTLAWGDKAITSQYFGNMEDLDVWQNALNVAEEFQRAYGISAKHYLLDVHPNYTANQWARQKKLKYTEILHHHAHASALAFEHDCTSEALFFIWDGLGFGKDGQLWGGETFYGKAGDWQRVCSLHLFKLIGGEQAIKQPWRIAASLCWHAGREYAGRELALAGVKKIWISEKYSPLSSSVGRLFDAAAALLGLIQDVTYDGQAAMLLETKATDATTDFIDLGLLRDGDQLYRADWSALLGMLQDVSLSRSYRAKVFHNALSQLILKQCLLFRREKGISQVGLSGGVFQNALLVALTRNLLEAQGFTVLNHKKMPINDSAISLGQVIEYGMKKYDA